MNRINNSEVSYSPPVGLRSREFLSGSTVEEMQNAQTRAIENLIAALKANMPLLDELLARMKGHWIYEDRIYRFYHHSFKVFDIQRHTIEIVSALQSLTPDYHLNKLFMSIVLDGTGRTFTLDDNQRWRQATAPIVEAFFHAMYFLEMAVKYGKLIESASGSLPSGWAALLYLYDLR